MALRLWFHQPPRTPSRDRHDNHDGDGDKRHGKERKTKQKITKNNRGSTQVNQQNHMVANKFDPRMDPVVVQVRNLGFPEPCHD